MTTSNEISLSKLTPDQVKDHIERARDGYVLSKNGTCKAVSHTFLIWLTTRAQSASPTQKAMSTKMINVRNADIEAHNAVIELLKKETKAYKADKLKDDHWTKTKTEDPAELAKIAARIGEYEKHLHMTNDQWNALKLLTIDVKTNASAFTEVVKWVLDFINPNQSSLISRYATVLEYLERVLHDENIIDIEQIMAALDAVGGFEQALLMQRAHKSGELVEDTNQKAKHEKTIEKIKSVVTQAVPLSSVDLEPRFAHDDLVVMLGLRKGGKVELVSELDVTSHELDSMLSRFDNDDILPTNDNCELVNRVMGLGNLIHEGIELEGSESDKKGGKKEKSHKIMIVKPNKSADGSELILTSQYAQSNIVIHAIPKQKDILGLPRTASMLSERAYNNVAKELKVRGHRSYISMTVDASPLDKEGNPVDAPLAWDLTNSAVPEKSNGWFNRVYFNTVLAKEHKPLDVDHFDPQFRLKLSRQTLKDLDKHIFAGWETLKAGDKNKRTIKFSIKDATITVSSKDVEHVITMDDSVEGRFVMVFNANDFHGLLKCLMTHHASSFTFTGDEAGVMEINWDDNLSQYKVYLPTCDKEGRLETRRIAPMRIKSPSMSEHIAAE